jgi:CRP-like cAMP-binding protein
MNLSGSIGLGTFALTRLARSGHTLSEVADMLNTSEWSDELDRRQLETLAEYMDCYEVDEGQTILEEHGDDHHLVMVIAGQVHIVKTGRGGVRKIITSIGPGKSFGEMSLIDREPRSAFAVAATPATLLVLSEQSFLRLNELSPSLGVDLLMKIARLLSQRLRETTIRLIEFL